MGFEHYFGDDMKTILLSIATGQNLANLIPALQIQPDEVWILATGKMKADADRLKRLLKQNQRPSRVIDFDDSDLITLERESEKFAEELDGNCVIFNATGGTKQMVLILAESLRSWLETNEQSDAFKILYADTAHQRIDWLYPEKRSEPMKDLLSLEDIVGIQGFQLRNISSRQEAWIEQVDARSALTRALADKVEPLSGFLGALNGLVQQAMSGKDGFNPRQEFDYRPGRGPAEILKKAADCGLLTWDGNLAIRFADEDAARYLGGIWLEEFAFLKLRGCKAKDFVTNPILLAADGQTKNEMDALVVHRNRLLAIECKTARFGRDGGKDADIMYKLDSLSQRAGGLMHERWLLSARPLDEASLARAKNMKIHVIAGREIRDFHKQVMAWMNQ